ncbi:MAG: isoprenylcysteine carboxylmethyltransferase family protein [Gemmatimonadaceae bacterium]
MTWSLTAKRLRLPLGFLLSFAYLALARPTQESLVIGGLIALTGVAVRAWASGHIMKNDRLATTGPYAHTRNPLYFGSFLIAAGFATAAYWALLFAVIGFFALIYRPTMEREETNIRGRFPDAYEKFEANVPAFVPRLTPWRAEGEGAENSFSPALYMKHGEWKALAGYIGAMFWLGLRVAGRV